MRKKWFDLKKGLGAAAIMLATAGMMLCTSTTQAANPEKVRGHVNVDISDFTLVDSTTSNTDDYGFAPEDDTGNRYKLHYKNSFTDRNKVGCTYRSRSKYDLTDVTALELYGYHYQTRDDKLLFYVNSDANKYYHIIDNSELTEDTLKGDGIACYMSEFAIGMYYDIQCERFNINPRYSSEYVFLGASHTWLVHDAEFFVDNRTIASDGSHGCMNLVLKKHTIELLESEKVTHVVVNQDGKSKEVPYNAFSNVKMVLENGNKYSPGETGDIYRDETVTIEYSLEDEDICDLTSFKFYSDKEKKNFLYEMNVTGKDNKCTFTLTSSVIQDMEEKAGKYKLGDIYVEPVFGTREATIEFSEVVVENKDNLEVVSGKTNTDGSKEYVLREKTGSGEEIGTFSMNQAHQVGDDIAIDYTPNKNYTGEYQFSYYEYRMSESKTQSDGTDQIIVQPSEDKIDIVENISGDGRYFWVRAHVKLVAEITLKDKETTYNGKEVKIDEATLTWPEGYRKPEGKITYYYYTDTECTKEMKSDELPVNAGTYYVKAVLSQDDYYEKATSNVAELTIDKATPILKNLKGETSIIYGQPVSKTTPEGTALGVTGQTLEGTFAWKDADYKPTAAGMATVEAIFTPNDLLAENYTTAIGMAKVTVDKATPTIQLEPYTKVFDGNALTSVPATITGVNGEATGQKLVYEFYTRKGEQYVKMLKAPVNAGTYYVSAYTASSNTNYGFAQSEEKAEVIIKQRECNLITVPVDKNMDGGINYTVRVYLANTVTGYKPEGKIKLVLDPNHSTNIGDYRELKADIVEENGKQYASYYLPGTPSSGFKLTASYVPASNSSVENYAINTNTLDVYSIGETNHKDVSLTYKGGSEEIIVKNAFNAISECKTLNVTWLNLANVNAGDVVKIDGTVKSETLTVNPQNAGSETLVAYVLGTTQTTTKSWYLFYDITVSPLAVNVSVADKTVTYSGNPVEADAASAACIKAGASEDITEKVSISYTYYRGYQDGKLSGELDSAPVNAGTYYVQATSEAQRNYQTGQSVSKLTIQPAEPVITVTDKTVTYDGQAHEPDPAIVTGIDGVSRESEEASDLDSDRLPSGSVSWFYDCDALDYHSDKKPVSAGEYTVTAIYTPGENDNYVQPEEHRKTAKLTIEPAQCEVEIEPMEMPYTGKKAEPNTLYFTGVDGKKTKTELEKVKGENKWKDREGNEFVFMYTLSADMNYTNEAPGAAGLYYVYAVRTEGGNYKMALSNRSTLLIKPADSNVTLEDATTTYNGDAVNMASLKPATVTNQNGEDITDAEVIYQYYEDQNAMIKIDAPVDAGTYYVQAFLDNHANYNAGKSKVQKLTIKKATPILSNLQATDVPYGTEVGASDLSGTATGVKGEDLNGIFAWAEAISHEKRDVGSHELAVIFIPGESAERNYTEATGEVHLQVTPFAPQMKGADQTEVYNGKAQCLTPVSVTGAEGMPAPKGKVTYTYYTDQTCTVQVPDSTEGVKDAGIYYCKVDFVSDTDNYTNVSKTYQIKIEKAEAIIALDVSTLGKDEESGSVDVKGALVGVFDNPTGTVTIYQKAKDADDSTYIPVAVNLPVSEQGGSYVFQTKMNITQGVYDFKAVYNEGPTKNYSVSDGEVKNVDMSKNPQNIYFEDKLIIKEYGSDDFRLEVVDQNNGPEKVIYRVLEKMGDPQAIKVSEDGTVQMKDTGKAFVMAEKPGNENYSVAYAFVAIQITKAPTKITLSDQVVTYTGKPAKIDEAVVTSHGKPVAEDEKIPVVYTYEHAETGALLDRSPVEAGVYKAHAYSIQNDHYQASDAREATLTIEKAKAKIVLEADHVDEKNRILTLQGSLTGVFDHPSGMITLYKKVSGQPDDKYEVAEENVKIVMLKEGSYGFRAKAEIVPDQTYDFKAVYQEGDVENYLITDGQLTQVSIKDVIDEQKEDEKNSEIDEEKNDRKGNDKDKKNTVDTGDQAPIFRYLLLLIVSMTIMIKSRKHAGR